MLGDGSGEQQEEKLHRFGVDGAVIDALGVSSEHDEGFHDEAAEIVTGVGQGEAVSDAGAMHFFPFDECFEQAGGFVGALLESGNELHQFVQDGIAVPGHEVELDGVGVHAAADGELWGGGGGEHGVV